MTNCPTAHTTTGLSPEVGLLNRWQRAFPLLPQPFAHIAAVQGADAAVDIDVAVAGWTESKVLQAYRAMQASGALSRIGGVFAAGAGGAALLCAMAVPAERLQAVAATVSAHAGVNHNYEREHRLNLWFVLTATDDSALEHALRGLEAVTGLPALRLRMQRAYRIDLGFDLGHGLQPPQHPPQPQPTAPALSGADRALAALVEAGLPLVPRPFDVWAQALGWTSLDVTTRLQAWLDAGSLRRFGCVVRHHELGFAANAMTVFDVPDAVVDACGAALACEPGITLAYRRNRADGWPFNLFCMVHGRDRDSVHALLAGVIERCGLSGCPRAVLFSRQRFKQTGARRFRPQLDAARMEPA